MDTSSGLLNIWADPSFFDAGQVFIARILLHPDQKCGELPMFLGKVFDG